MSHHVYQTIECDVRGCVWGKKIEPGESVAEARGRLEQRLQWKTGITVPGARGRKFDVCPNHSEADLQ